VSPGIVVYREGTPTECRMALPGQSLSGRWLTARTSRASDCRRST